MKRTIWSLITILILGLGISAQSQGEISEEIERLRAERQRLLVRYSAEAAEVKAVDKRIAYLEFQSQAARSASGVERKYDKFKDQTQVTVELIRMDHSTDTSWSWSLSALFVGDSLANRQSIGLLIFSSSKDWRMLRRDLTLRAIVDGERLNLGEMKRFDSSVGRGYVTESLLTLLSPVHLAKLGFATSVEVQVAGIEYALTAEQIQRIKAFAETIGLKKFG